MTFRYHQQLFQVRTDSDYDDFYLISLEEVQEQLKSAQLFVNEIKRCLSEKTASDF